MRLNKIILLPFFSLIFLISLILNSCENKKGEDLNLVAKIGDDYKITQEELRKYVYDNFFDKIFKDKKEGFRRALDQMITTQLKCYDFFDSEFNKNNDLVQSIQRNLNEELIVVYFNKEFLGKYTSEDFVRKTYEEMGRQVNYQQIVINKPEKATEAQLKSFRETAGKIEAEMKKGIEINKINEKYSKQIQPMNLNENVYITDWDRSLSTPLDREVFRLNSGDIRVIDTYDAYHIVKVKEVKKVDVEPFEKIRDEIVSKLKNTYESTSLDEYDKVKEESLDENSIEWNQKALDQLVAWLNISDFYKNVYKDTLQNVIKSGRNSTILTYTDGKVDFKEYLRLLDNIVIPQNSKNIDEEGIKKFVIEAIRTSKMVEQAKALGLGKNIFHKKTNNPILKNEIVKLYNDVVVDEQTPEANQENLKKFYEVQKDSLYHPLDKVNSYVMIYDNRQKADEVMKKIDEGTAFEKISGRWFVKTFIRDHNGEIKPLAISDGPYLGEIAFQLKLNQTFGPVEYSDPDKGKQYAVVKCINIRPEKQLLYSDVKNSIEKDFKDYYRKRILAKNKAQLWQKYDIHIYEDALPKNLNSGK